MAVKKGILCESCNLPCNSETMEAVKLYTQGAISEEDFKCPKCLNIPDEEFKKVLTLTSSTFYKVQAFDRKIGERIDKYVQELVNNLKLNGVIDELNNCNNGSRPK